MLCLANPKAFHCGPMLCILSLLHLKWTLRPGHSQTTVTRSKSQAMKCLIKRPEPLANCFYSGLLFLRSYYIFSQITPCFILIKCMGLIFFNMAIYLCPAHHHNTILGRLTTTKTKQLALNGSNCYHTTIQANVLNQKV